MIVRQMELQRHSATAGILRRRELQARLQLARIHKEGELSKIPRSGMKTRTTHQNMESPQLQSVA
jgi:hypothetical protein